MAKNLLIYFPGFEEHRFLSTQNEEAWGTLPLSEFKKLPILKVLGYFRQPTQMLLIGRPSLRARELQRIFTAFFIFVRAKTRGFVDNEDNIQYVNRITSLAAGMILAIEIFAAFFVVLFAYILLGVARIASPLRKHARKFRRPEGEGMIAFMRTDWWDKNVGGSFTHTEGFVGGMRKLGYSAAFFCHKLPVPYFGEGDKFIQLPPHRLLDIPEIPEIFSNFEIAFRMARKIKQINPIFIYQRNTFASCASVLISMVTGIPLIYEFNGSEAWARQFWGGRLFLKRLAYLAEDICFSGADIIAVVSQVLKDDLTKKGVPGSKIIVNPNGVDPDKFRPNIDGFVIRQKYGLENKIVVGFVGTFGPWHGADVLAKAIQSVVGKNQNTRFLFVGDGAMRQKVEEIINRDGVGRFVTMVGSISHNEMPSYLAACDISVNPTVLNEDGSRFFGSPTKLFEYMAMGKAIVASNLEQIGHVLEHEKTALLVKPGDAEELASAIVRLAEEEGLRKRLGEGARKEVITNYTWEMNAKRVIEAYLRFGHNVKT